MAFRRRKKKAHLQRDARGKFLKRKRRHHRMHARRRRSNPMPVLLAIPRRRRRRHHAAAAIVPHRRRRRHHATRPRRRRRHLRATHRKSYRRRRSNPFHFRLSSLGGWIGTVRAAAWGGLGIATVRIAGGLYTRHVDEHVRGAEGKADPKHWRAIVSEILRLVAMGASAVMGDRLLRMAPGGMVRPIDRMTFQYAGVGEAGRQGIGLAIKLMSPSTSLERYGLSGEPGDVIEQDGAQWMIGQDGNMYQLETGGSGLGELTDAQDFAGMGELTDAQDFAGMGELVEEDEFYEDAA